MWFYLIPCITLFFSLACQTSFRAGRYRFEIISARAEKGLDQFTVKTGTDTSKCQHVQRPRILVKTLVRYKLVIKIKWILAQR